MYTIHKTQGIILSKHPRGEANNVLFLATRDLGCLYAISQSSRLLSSKLRSNLDLFTFATFDLVRGKEAWRVVGATPERGARPLPPEAARIFARIGTLIKRLSHGEEPNERLFLVLLSVRNFLLTHPVADAKSVELVAALQTLDALGYGPEGVLLPLAKASLEEAIYNVPPLKKEVARHVNNALVESQL